MPEQIPITPIDDKVVLRPLKKQTKSSGGVIIPDAAMEQLLLAKVVAVGRGRVAIDGSLKEMQTKVGDTVIYPKIGGQKFQYKNDTYYIIREQELIAIINDENTGDDNEDK